jgi:hypothetical protein
MFHPSAADRRFVQFDFVSPGIQFCSPDIRFLFPAWGRKLIKVRRQWGGNSTSKNPGLDGHHEPRRCQAAE